MGLDLTDIKIKSKRCEKKNFDTIDTSCIVDPNIPIVVGNIFQFKIPLNELERFHLLETVMLLWFGRLFVSKVVDMKKFADYGRITIELENMKAALPLYENKFLFENGLLKRTNDYISAVLEIFNMKY